MIDAQATQRVVEGSPQVPPRGAVVVRAGARRKPALGRDDELIGLARVRRQPAPDDLLAPAGGVDVGRVDEVAAARDIGVYDRVRRHFIGLAPRSSTERLFENNRSATTEAAVLVDDGGALLVRQAESSVYCSPESSAICSLVSVISDAFAESWMLAGRDAPGIGMTTGAEKLPSQADLLRAHAELSADPFERRTLATEVARAGDTA